MQNFSQFDQPEIKKRGLISMKSLPDGEDNSGYL